MRNNQDPEEKKVAISLPHPLLHIHKLLECLRNIMLDEAKRKIQGAGGGYIITHQHNAI